MELLVNGEVRELNIYDSNGIDWSNDLIGNNTDWSQYKTDEDTELKIVDEEFFDWWSEYIENYTTDEAEAENLARQFGVDISEIKEKIADNMADCTDMDMEHTIKQSVFDEIRTSAAAAALGRKGGKSKSAAKAKASAENGKLGGRPRKGGNEMKKAIINTNRGWKDLSCAATCTKEETETM